MESLTNYHLNPDTIGIYKACFDTNGSPKRAENIEWQFFKNTEKTGYVDIAFDTEKQKAAAIYAVSCVKFKIGGEVSVGTQSLDTITDVDYRGKGLFINLAKSVYKNAANNGVALVYGFPNGNSIHGFAKKLDWQVLDPVPFLMKPLRSKYFSDRIKFLKWLPNVNLSWSGYTKDKNFSIAEQNHFPEAADALWTKFSKNIPVAVQRDAAYLNWRYVQKPNEHYKIAHCHDAQGHYCGLVVYTVKQKHAGSVAYIMELIYDTDRPKVGKQLLDYAIADIKKHKADCILSWCFAHSPNFGAYKSAAFFDLPEKLRPIELHFGVCTFDEKCAPLTNQRSNWYLSYSDSDTV
ncbi:GNAT family N-acetyltransferase [Flavobacterium caeni]|uniref:Acetyltransferase (GNAT) domain-containing protein n=1 Tax=Flavobacterium caeni TaxID=490189 RepID=A0A1G5FIL2_9FLAO|nr:GNAT family N-acetyltransferase [Flavobacterium caeni]SCY39109.1 Acetyltransferase (GNAT) domain-containing protein [Flavobacterium caeni]